MDEMIRVLVADADSNARQRLCAGLTRLGFAAYSAEDGREALHGVMTLRPDALLLSLTLPVWDGLFVLQQLNERWLSRYPRVLALTAMDDAISTRALHLGAEATLQEPVEAEAVEPFLRQDSLEPSKLALHHALARQSLAEQAVLALGIPPHLKGFSYLSHAVALVSADDQLLRRATLSLYPRIGAAFGVSDHSVERAIRHAIETTWTRGRMEVLHSAFGNSIDPQRGKPTNTECIALLSERLWETHAHDEEMPLDHLT